MIRFARRYRKTLAAALLLLNMSGGRVYAATDACQRTHVYFGPSLSFKMVAKTVGCAAANAPWKRSQPRSLGERLKKTAAQDLATLRGSSARLIVRSPGVVLTVAALPRRAPPQTLAARSSELGPVPPLHTRK